MKKLIALLMVSGFAFAFVACGGGEKKAEENTEAVETPTVTPADSAAMETDTTATSTDTTAAQ